MCLFHSGLVKFPEFRRVEELGHFSEGWPPLSESKTKKWRGACVRISIFLTLVVFVLTIAGFKMVLAETTASVTIPASLLAEVWGQQLMAPVFLLLLEGLIAYGVFLGKRIPPVLMVLGWIGAFMMPWGASVESHSISHALFESCTGYDEFIFWLAASIALSISAIWLLEFRVLRGAVRIELKIARNIKRVLVVLAIFGCWLGALYFLDVL